MEYSQLKTYIIQHIKEIEEYVIFPMIVLLAGVVKIIKEKKDNSRYTFSWLLASLITSFLVAYLIYAVFDQFFNLNKFFCYTMSAWGSTFSSTFQDKSKDLLESIFDYLKVWIKTKLT